MGGWTYRVALGALPDGEQNAVGGAVLGEAAPQPVLRVCVRSISITTLGLPRASGRRERGTVLSWVTRWMRCRLRTMCSTSANGMHICEGLNERDDRHLHQPAATGGGVNVHWCGGSERRRRGGWGKYTSCRAMDAVSYTRTGTLRRSHMRTTQHNTTRHTTHDTTRA